jgi:hypothetical protein
MLSGAPFSGTLDESGLYGPYFSPNGVALAVSEPVTNLTEVRLSSAERHCRYGLARGGPR